MKARLILAAFIIPLGLIIAAVPENTTKPYKLAPEKLLQEIRSGSQYLHPDQVADMVIQKDPSLQLIDVRKADDFEKFSLPGAINIPLDDFLNPDWEAYINQDARVNVFYSNSSNEANEAWMIARQLGYKNNYVLQGGLNYWAETIMNPEVPAATSPNEEIARYNFRKGAGSALGAAPVEAEINVPAAPLPDVKPAAKKKRVKGGC